MMKFIKLLLTFLVCFSCAFGVRAALQDQGLNSIMLIIDKAIEELNAQADDGSEDSAATIGNAVNTIINLSRTLGTLSYSRLQCGEAGVLAEFTRRVQRMPENSRNPMRDAFQEGFDKTKAETPLLSQDECERLTRSRQRREQETEANVAKDNDAKPEPQQQPVEVDAEELSGEDPKFRHLRIAELTGQLAFKRKFCNDEKTFTRDYNEYLASVPETYREAVKNAYWRGYKHGKRINKYLTKDQC